MASNGSRVLLSFQLPLGSLSVTIASPTKESENHVFVSSVDTKSPCIGVLYAGDRLVSINGIDLRGQSREFCGEVLRAASQAVRTLTISRYVSPSRTNNGNRLVTSASMSKENVENKPIKKPKLPSKPIVPKKQKPAAAKKKKTPKPAPLPSIEYPEVLPEPGFVCKKHMFYSTKNNETLALVAEKLGTDWKLIAALPQNTSRYGPLKGNTRFQTHTLLYIPQKRSQWKMKQLSMQETDEVREECVQCGVSSNPAEMLLCDGCDDHNHIGCVDLSAVPEGDWFCSQCLAVLQARKEHNFDPKGLPELPPLQPPQNFDCIQQSLQKYLRNRRTQELEVLSEIAKAAQQSWQTRAAELKVDIARLSGQVNAANVAYSNAQRNAMDRFGVAGWKLPGGERGWIKLRDGSGNVTQIIESSEIVGYLNGWRYSPDYSLRWQNAYKLVKKVWNEPRTKDCQTKHNELKKKLAAARESLAKEGAEADSFASSGAADRERCIAQYAALLGEEMLPNETPFTFKNREPCPRYLGRVVLTDDGDVLAMNMLREPDELIITMPFGHSLDETEPSVGRSYSIFARMALFDKSRDDELPLENNGVRDAQRRLFHLLLRSEANKNMVVSRAALPPTVKLRTRDEDNNSSRCFDLSELVRDCEVDLDLPREPTPEMMAKNGLQLRDYQQSSLRWMLDKEMESNGLGLAGEFWHRLRFQDPTADGEYYYCELTGSIALDVFDYRKDVEQSDASLNQFSMPTGGVLGDEMGLGKTAVSIALIIANPPPLHRRVLPLEYSMGKRAIDHPGYLPPPSAGKQYLSNGTLIIVPMTLLSQWQTEIERFAPHLSVTTLHNEENPTTQAVASRDVVIATTYLLQRNNNKKGTRNLLSLIKRIHWHRIMVDESHAGHSKLALSALSATHRHSITGTPIGSQLNDLYGQVRFLRIAPFHREKFWKNQIEEPYYERSDESLRVLRSFLSRTVVRHSKRQTKANGEALLALPPRTVETVMLQFGSEAEKEVYSNIEQRCKQHFMGLKKESKKTVASHYIELTGLATSLRQAAAHSSIVSLEKLDRFNRNEILKKNKKNGNLCPRPTATADKTRVGILQLAVSRARPSATIRMRLAVEQYQNGHEHVLECPVCFEIVGETDIILPACAHPVCSFCIGELLGAANSTTREASAHCPTCRDVIRRSEVTYLGEATDAGAVKQSALENVEEESKSVAASSSLTLNGFQMTQLSVHVEGQAGASTLRASREALSDSDLLTALRRDKALLHTLDENLVRSHYISEEKVGTKIARLLFEINEMKAKNSNSKAVVFTQFLGMLDVAQAELMARGIGCVRIDGSLKQHERADALMEFSNNNNIVVCLLSMRSGAVGLNLQIADNVFIMDIAQNSAIEEQSIDRIHRPAVGVEKRKAITVKRFVMEGTVEERLLGARRSLGIDQASEKEMAGTQISGMDAAGDDGAAKRPSKRARTEEKVDSGARQKRVEFLEALFGCSGVHVNVHKA